MDKASIAQCKKAKGKVCPMCSEQKTRIVDKFIDNQSYFTVECNVCQSRWRAYFIILNIEKRWIDENVNLIEVSNIRLEDVMIIEYGNQVRI